MFLLDTNVVSELRKVRPHGALLAWYNAQPATSFFIPSIVLYEIQAAVELTRQQDGGKAKEIEKWLNQIAEETAVLNLDTASARLAAKLLHGKPPELLEDAMIAAIAASNGLTVATRNIRDFKQFCVAAVNPFADTR